MFMVEWCYYDGMMVAGWYRSIMTVAMHCGGTGHAQRRRGPWRHIHSIPYQHKETHIGCLTADQHVLQIYRFPMCIAIFRTTSGTRSLSPGYVRLRALLYPELIRCFTNLGLHGCREFATKSLEPHACANDIP